MTPDTFDLTGKVAIVTGSGRENGIGAAIVRALARNGAAVTINHVSESVRARAQKFAEQIKAEEGKVAVIAADVTTAGGAEKLAKGTLEAFGVDHIDILVNNAGSGDLHSTLEMSQAAIDKCFNVNLFAAIHMVRAAVPHMPQGGRIINISSITWKLGMSAASMYCAAKAGMDALTMAWAQEFGKSRGITANSVAPGPVYTDINAEYQSEDFFQPVVDMTRAADRVGTPEDIADITLFIASEKSRWVTGQYISASGGVTVG